MADIINPSEPDPERGPVRVWLDGTPPVADTLGEIRESIELGEDVVVEELLERKGLVIGATLFKANAGEVLAPERRAAVIERVVEKARELAPEDTDFHEFIRDTWEFMVPRFVAMQAKAFENTRPLPIPE